MSSLEARTALVTGASRGIGRAIAIELAARGVHVGLVARSADALAEVANLIEHRGGTVAVAVAELAEPQQANEAVGNLEKILGGTDILINNAGVHWPMGSMGTIDIDEWERAVAINLLAPVRLSVAVLPGMLARGWGRIINVSSGSTTRGRPDLSNAYFTTKSALEAHSRNLALELEGTGVTVNILRPGVIDTELQAYVRQQDPEVIGADLHRRFVERFENGELHPPEEPARVTADLLETDANGEAVVGTPTRVDG